MKKITNSEYARINWKCAAVEEAAGVLSGAIEEYNAAMYELREAVQTIAEDAESHYQAQSEHWRGSEAGFAYDAWIDAWTVYADECSIRSRAMLGKMSAMPDAAPEETRS
jgi:hypothetical protein